MPPTYLQEVSVSLSNHARFTIFIANTEGESSYEASLLLRDPSNALTRVGIAATHTDAPEALNEAIRSIASYLAKNSVQVTAVDSPCNALFIDLAAQEKVLRQHGIHVAPTVNSQEA
jgi:hypothetical protein